MPSSAIRHARKSSTIRILALMVGAVFFIIIGFITGRTFQNECNSSVLGAHTSSNSILSNLAMMLKVNPEIPTQQTDVIQITPTPTSKSQWPTFSPTPTSTPTPTPVSQWPTFSPTPTSTPTPTPGSHGPTTGNSQSINVPITPDKLNELTNSIGITLIPEATASPSPSHGTHGPTSGGSNGTHGPTTGNSQPTTNSSVTFKGNMQDKILGLIQISYPATLSVNTDGGITVSADKSWWQKILTNPLSGITSGLMSCTSFTGESSCIKNGCSYWSNCGKCEDTTTSYDPTCSCNIVQTKGACNSSTSCEWHPECVGGGTCVGIGSSSKIACGGCGNVIGQNACFAAGCTYSNNQCQ